MKNKKAIMKNNRDTSGHTVRKKDFTDLIQASSKHRGKKKKQRKKVITTVIMRESQSPELLQYSN